MRQASADASSNVAGAPTEGDGPSQPAFQTRKAQAREAAERETCALPPAVSRIHPPIGVTNPVLLRLRLAAGSARFGTSATDSLALTAASCAPGGRAARKKGSTYGTRISIECAMPAQSASRSS